MKKCIWDTLLDNIIFLVDLKGHIRSYLVAQMVESPPPVCEIWVRSLGKENSLEMEMATHSSALAWKIPWTEEPGRIQSMELQSVRHDWATSLYTLHINSHSCVLIYVQGHIYLYYHKLFSFLKDCKSNI